MNIKKENNKNYVEAVNVLKKLGLVVGEGQGSETGYFVSLDRDIDEKQFEILKSVFGTRK